MKGGVYMGTVVPLTADQRLLVAESHNLIYSFLMKHNLDRDEFYDIAALGLCNAAQHWSPDVGYKFSSYAYRAMLNTCIRQMNITRRQVKSISLDAPVNTHIEDSDTLADLIPDPEGERSDYDLVATVDMMLSRMPPRMRQIVELTRKGYTRSDVATMLGVSRAYVYKVLSEARKHMT